MAHPVFAENVTEVDGNWTKASNNGAEDVGQIWGMWGPETWDCKALFNDRLDNSTQFDAVASSAASTIMSLLPSLLSFAPIVTARIGLLSNLSHSHGVIAAAFTFGLPVVQLEVITAQSVTSIKKLLGNVEDAKRLLGIVQDAVPTAGDPVDSTSTGDLHTTASSLGAPSSSITDSARTQLRVNVSTSCDSDNGSRSFNDIVENALSGIKDTAFGCNRPSIWIIHAAKFLSTVIHLFLVWCLLTIVLLADPSTLIWDCRDAGWLTVGLLLGILGFVGPLRMRFERNTFATTDIIHISKVSNTGTMGTTYWSRLRAPHPMIVMLRPSPNAISNLNGQGSKVIRGLKVVYFIGVSQLCWILFLSFFFSSSIGGSLFWSLLTVWTFVLAVAVSRGLSILTIWLVEKHIGLQVIEYDDLLELEVMRGLIGALPEARVEARGNPNSLWEKGYLQGQSAGYGNGTLEVGTSSVSWGEVIPMVSALVIVIMLLLHISKAFFVGMSFWGEMTPLLTFGIISLFKGKEKWIVLRNRGVDVDQA